MRARNADLLPSNIDLALVISATPEDSPAPSLQARWNAALVDEVATLEERGVRVVVLRASTAARRATAPVFDEEYDGDMARRKNSVDIEGVIRVAEFRSALRQFLRESERTTRSAGLTPQRYLLLLMIKGAPDGSQQASIGELSDRLQLAQSTVTELVNRAEDSGLVSRRQSDADGRVSIVRLTRKGETRLARAIEESDAERRRLRQTVLRLGESGGKGRARKG